MDVIGLDASLVRGSHGSITSDSEGPLFITQSHLLDDTAALEATDIYELILRHLKAPIWYELIPRPHLARGNNTSKNFNFVEIRKSEPNEQSSGSLLFY